MLSKLTTSFIILAASAAPAFADALRAPLDVSDVIESVEGTTKYFSKDCSGIRVTISGWPEDYSEEGFASQIVFGDNDDVYFKNILSFAPTDTYVKGILRDNSIFVPLPQTIFVNDAGAINIGLMKYFDDGDYMGYKPIAANVVTFEMKDDGSIRMFPLGEDVILGNYYATDGEWTGFGDKTQVYAPYDKDIVYMPEDVEIMKFRNMISDDYGYFVNVARVDDTLYIQGLTPTMPEGVFRAELREDGKAYVAQNQVLGMVGSYFIYTKAFVNEATGPLDPDHMVGYLEPDDVEYVFSYDEEAGEIRFDSTDNILILNGQEDYVMCFAAFGNLTLTRQDSMAGTPCNPSIIGYDDHNFEFYGFYTFQFDLSVMATDGNLLDRDNLSYKVFLDGEPLEFECDPEIWNYLGIPLGEVWTSIPFDFNNNNDIFTYSQTERWLGIWVDGVSTIGVQEVYECDGVTTESDIITLDIETGEISSSGVAMTAADDAAGEWYSLSGSRVDNPSRGIFLRKSIGADGKAQFRKVVVR